MNIELIIIIDTYNLDLRLMIILVFFYQITATYFYANIGVERRSLDNRAFG